MDQPPKPTVNLDDRIGHEHDWQAAGLIHSQNGDMIAALCGCGRTRRFALPDHVIYVDEDGTEILAPDTWTAIGQAAHLRPMPPG